MFSQFSLARVLGKRRFEDLNEQEILALAISAEEEDAQIYTAYAERLRNDYPATAAIFDGMTAEENTHRRRLLDVYQERFGSFLVPLRREQVAGFPSRQPVWLIENLSLDRIREETTEMERQARDFYLSAAARSTDTSIRKLLGDLAAEEAGHQTTAQELTDTHLDDDALRSEAHTSKKQFLLTWVQPGVAGLMDGSVSTLAPIFATAFATHDPWTTFLVGLSASVGAGISMGFTEAVHDDGKLSGRGSPIKRGFASGVMTTLGGLGHTLPYLLPSFWTATTVALIIVFFELWAIVWIQNKYMDTPMLRAAVQVLLGGSLVLAAGILIGGA
ncbi:MAG: rubrerythrin family protein [Alphaproteobacteria bacterium]|nr:rubrerythrin family protein [Alphaproteobacteria bacterium]